MHTPFLHSDKVGKLLYFTANMYTLQSQLLDAKLIHKHLLLHTDHYNTDTIIIYSYVLSMIFTKFVNHCPRHLVRPSTTGHLMELEKKQNT